MEVKKPSYYEFFGLKNFEENKEVIRRAYRSMALKYHPDRCKDKVHGEHMMKQVNEIFLVLSNHKDEYDTHLRKKFCSPEQSFKTTFTYRKPHYGKSIFEQFEQENNSFEQWMKDDIRPSMAEAVRKAKEQLVKKRRQEELIRSLTMEEADEVENFIKFMREGKLKQ
jgi:molecular chaperone DnaJ